ncbi:MAG: Xaa-Pro peptidase family protein [Firmicutes bacterium]|nr:Xaa-Pro peptidase family protein [Bacillota bacterium]
MQDYAMGQFQVDYEKRIDFDLLRKKKIDKVLRAMENQGVDALFLWKDENVRYLSNLRIIMLQYRGSTTYGVLLTKEGNLALFLNSGELDRAQEAMPWIQDFYPIPIMDEPGLADKVVGEKVKPLFDKYNLTGARVAIDAMSILQFQAYRKYLPKVEWVDGESLMQNVRMIKFPEEIQIIQEATALADAVTQAAIDNVRPGMRECEIAGEAMRVMYRLGAEFGHTTSAFVASGERMAPPTRFATDKLVRYGDIVFIDIGAFWNGYFSDVGRTVICGKPSKEQKRIYQAVYSSLKAGIQKMRPGVRTSEAAAAFINQAKEFGLEKNFINLFIGHGTGAAPAESPFVGETMPGANDPVLQLGMVIALEPLIWVKGVRGGGGIRIEDMVLVTDGDPVVLSRAPYDELLLD